MARDDKVWILNHMFNRSLVAWLLLPVIFFVSSCALVGADPDELATGILSLEGAPCTAIESVVPVADDEYALYCLTETGAELIFFNISEQRAVRRVDMTRENRVGSGRIRRGTDVLWASVEPASTDTPDNVRQVLALYGVDESLDQELLLHGGENKTVVGTYFNSLANCAVIRVQNGPRRNWSAFTAEVLLVDFSALQFSDLHLASELSGVFRTRSTPERRLDHPSASMLGSSRAACLRLSDQTVGLSQSFTQRGQASENWRSALEFARINDGGLLRDRNLTRLSRSLKVFYPVSSPGSLVAAISDENAPRLANIVLLVLDEAGNATEVQPLAESLSWQFFDANRRIGLALTVRQRGVERGALYLVDCRDEDCITHPTGLVVDRPLQLLAQEMPNGVLPLRACVANADASCDWQLFLLNFDVLMENI